jgi:hypothetical protein
MRNNLLPVAALALACCLTTACELFDKKESPTSPTPVVSLDAFAGKWVTSRSALPATSCGALTYTVTPVNASTATVTFDATCASSIRVTGTGTGKVSGATLDWNAQGSVSQGGMTCPFTFNNGKTTEDAGGIKVVYSGTVCGIQVSGDEVLKKP